MRHSSDGERHPSSLSDLSIRSYVLRQGRMTDAQKDAIARLGRSYMLPPPSEPGALLDFPSIFGNAKPVVMEIGFGMGQASWQIARDRPEYNYVGVEVHAPGVGRLLQDIAREKLENLRIVQRDAVDVLQQELAPASLAGLHIFYPDPWPKKRHHKRRIMRSSIVRLMTAALAPAGYIYFITDIEDYALWTKDLLSGTPALRTPFESFAPRREWRPETRFEAKASRAQRGVWELWFEKI